MQQAQALAYHFLRKSIDACRIPPWSGEVGDETKLDWIFRDSEDNFMALMEEKLHAQ